MDMLHPGQQLSAGVAIRCGQHRTRTARVLASLLLIITVVAPGIYSQEDRLDGVEPEPAGAAPIIESNEVRIVAGGQVPFFTASTDEPPANGSVTTVDSAAALAVALRDQSIQLVALIGDIELSEVELGPLPIEVWRDVAVTSASGAKGPPANLSSSLSRSTEWLSLQNGTLTLSRLRLGPGMLEIGHDDGHMPVTLVGVYLYGHDFDSVAGAATYCGCTGFVMKDILADGAFAPHRDDIAGSTPRQVIEWGVRSQRTWARNLQRQSVFTTDRWGFLHLQETVYPAMRFRLRNTTVIFPSGTPDQAQFDGPPQEECNTVTVPGAGGREYVGSIDRTAGGLMCMAWSSVHLAGLNFSGVGGNACRNPGDMSAAWCFTTTYERGLEPDFPYHWDYCDIPSCAEANGDITSNCTSSEDNGASYAGNLSVAYSGIPCDNWTESYPALFGYLQNNQCRNPSGDMPYVGCVIGAKYTACNVQPCEAIPVGPSGIKTADIIAAVVAFAAVGLLCLGAAWCSVKRRRQDICRPGSAKGSPMSSESDPAGSEAGKGGDFAIDNNNTRKSTREKRMQSDTGTDATGSTLKSLDDNMKSELEEDTLILGTPVEIGLLTLKKCLGAGSFAKVWQGRWLGADVAVKVMVLSGRQAHLKVHLLKGVEANFLRTITHPNVVQTYHIYKVQDRKALSHDSHDEEEASALKSAGISTPISEIWIVQELCNKGDLKRNCHLVCPQQRGSLSILLFTLREIMLALSYLHHNDIVHGDLKRENILLKSSTTPHGFSAKVADFGLARNLQGLETYYASSMSGDMKYLAPETLETHKISPKMDIYSFGFLIWELATGQAVGADNVTLAVHVQQVVKERKRPEFPAFILPELVMLAQSCWEHDMQLRPCAQLVLECLDKLVEKHCLEDYRGGSCMDGESWRDMTSKVSALMSKGTAVPEDEGGYVIMPPAESLSTEPVSPAIPASAISGMRDPHSDSLSIALAPVPEDPGLSIGSFSEARTNEDSQETVLDIPPPSAILQLVPGPRASKKPGGSPNPPTNKVTSV